MSYRLESPNFYCDSMFPFLLSTYVLLKWFTFWYVPICESGMEVEINIFPPTHLNLFIYLYLCFCLLFLFCYYSWLDKFVLIKLFSSRNRQKFYPGVLRWKTKTYLVLQIFFFIFFFFFFPEKFILAIFFEEKNLKCNKC